VKLCGKPKPSVVRLRSGREKMMRRLDGEPSESGWSATRKPKP
jgi:hypothetical protein